MTSIQERRFRGFSVSLFLRLSCCCSRKQRTTDPSFFLCIKKNTETENPRKQRSCIDVTGPLSLVSCLARFCTQLEVKFRVFDRLKRGEEKSIANLFFRFSYENNKKIRSSKQKKICHIHFNYYNATPLQSVKKYFWYSIRSV